MASGQQFTDFPQRVMPERVMLVIHSMNGGGSERQMSYLANEIVGVSATSLVTLSETGTDRYPLDHRIQRFGLGLTSQNGGLFRGLLGNTQRIRRLRKLMRTWRPDVVVSFCDSTNVLSLIAFSGSVPVVISERSDPRSQRMSRAWEWMRDRYYPKCQLCVAQTTEVGNYLIARRLVPSSHMRVIPSAIQIPEADTTLRDTHRQSIVPKTLMFLGRLSHTKRVDRLLVAWSRLRHHHRSWNLNIVGDGPDRAALQQQAALLKLDETVQWSLWSDNVWESLRTASAYCLVSDYEGFPQSMLEAMAAGLPVAVLDCSPAIREVIADGENGLIIDSEERISTVLDRLLSDSDLRLKLGGNAADRARQFDWKFLGPRWIDAIASAIK